ncbi:hypothetical protein EAI_03583 [Harpegnathos saltator]|uniref:Uncharacterized protein n=1 Tax=Harpegnathos saltator TaxID=610380 RepID=E2B873_HARSA|nr:hypothetical protein EAI_03583 [Harpegnathos saltator]
MLEDLNNTVVDDVAFKIIIKSYLNTKQQLRQLEFTLKKEEQQLQADNEEIRRLADDIRKQAEAALITYE